MPTKVKINIITGALGSGKTSLISSLIRAKSESAWKDERWSVLVNEFGALGIDGALLESASSSSSPSQSITVREMAGGCLCCTLSGPLAMAVPQLIRQTKPTRLFIEPSGLGHPSKLLELLQGENLRNSLEVMSVICLFDMRVASMGTCLGNSTYQSQIDVADVLVGTFFDVSSPKDQKDFQSMASELFPPKTLIHASLSGPLVNVVDLFAPILDLPRNNHFTTLLKPSNQISQLIQADPVSREELWAKGLPSRHVSSSGAKVEAVGWLWAPTFEFKRKELVSLCQCLSPSTGRTLRLKGVVKLEGGGFKSIKYLAGGDVDLEDLALPREDTSRIEIIFSPNPNRGDRNHVSDISKDILAIADAVIAQDFDLVEGLMLTNLSSATL